MSCEPYLVQGVAPPISSALCEIRGYRGTLRPLAYYQLVLAHLQRVNRTFRKKESVERHIHKVEVRDEYLELLT